jgi:hypothetical protein
MRHRLRLDCIVYDSDVAFFNALGLWVNQVERIKSGEQYCSVTFPPETTIETTESEVVYTTPEEAIFRILKADRCRNPHQPLRCTQAAQEKVEVVYLPSLDEE